MKKFIAICGMSVLLGGLFLIGAGRTSQSEEDALKEILALEKATLDGWYGESDPTAYAELFADKATYFDPWAGGRLEDSDIKEYLMTFMGKVPNLGATGILPGDMNFPDGVVFLANRSGLCEFFLTDSMPFRQLFFVL